MRFNHLLSAIYRGPWAIQHETALGYLPQVAAMLNGEQPASGAEMPPVPATQSHHVAVAAVRAGSVASTRKYSRYDDVPAGSVAVHQLQGVMMKNDQVGLCTDVPGTASLARAIREADAHENIVAHVLNIDSGGGTVDGTVEFAATLAGLSKPIVAYSDGIIASAAYWGASACSEVILNNASCSVGSIGVMATFRDYQAALAKLGVKEHMLRADDSNEKNEVFLQALEGNYKPYTDQVLNPLREMFASAVRENRAGKLPAGEKGDKYLKGSMYFAQDAQKAGLIDAIGSFDYAVERALELAREATSDNPADKESATHTPKNSIPNAMFGKNKYPAVSALAGKTGEELTAEMVQAANAELEAAGITGAALITEASFEQLQEKANSYDELKSTADANAEKVTAYEQALKAAGADSVEDLAKDRDTQKELAAKYGAKSGTASSTPKKVTPDVREGADDNQKAIASLAHNQALADDPLFAD